MLREKPEIPLIFFYPDGQKQTMEDPETEVGNVYLQESALGQKRGDMISDPGSTTNLSHNGGQVRFM